MTTENTNLFNLKAIQNLPKLGFFGLKIYHLATLIFIHGPVHDTKLCLFPNCRQSLTKAVSF
jgi:hypothetical protein